MPPQVSSGEEPEKPRFDSVTVSPDESSALVNGKLYVNAATYSEPKFDIPEVSGVANTGYPKDTGSTKNSDTGTMESKKDQEVYQGMADSYTKSESDLQLKLIEERVDHKLDNLINEVKSGFKEVLAHVDSTATELGHKVDLKNKSIDHLWWAIGVIITLLVGLVVGMVVFELQSHGSSNPVNIYTYQPAGKKG